MLEPSFQVLFPEIDDRIVSRLRQAFLRLAAFSQSPLLFLSLGWRGYIPPGPVLPSSIPETHHSGVPFPLGAGHGGVLLRFSL